MTRKQGIILAIVVAAGGLAVGALVVTFAVGFFAGHEGLEGSGDSQQVFASGQSTSSHPGYSKDTLTGGADVYVRGYEEACLQLAYPEPRQFIGRIGRVGNARVGAIPGQPTTAYVAADVGSEMPAYAPYRHVQHPPFDWRAATFGGMAFHRPNQSAPHLTSTDAALIAEVIRALREGAPVTLAGFPYADAMTFSSIRMASPQLPGLLFCPVVRFDRSGAIYLAESLMLDHSANPVQWQARWVPVTPRLADWLKSR